MSMTLWSRVVYLGWWQTRCSNDSDCLCEALRGDHGYHQISHKGGPNCMICDGLILVDALRRGIYCEQATLSDSVNWRVNRW